MTKYAVCEEGSSVFLEVGTLAEAEAWIAQQYANHPSYQGKVRLVRITDVALHTREQCIPADPSCYVCGRRRDGKSEMCPKAWHP